MNPRPSRFEKRLRPKMEMQVVVPAPVEMVQPEPAAEEKPGIVHLGGAWYLVGEQKVRGKEQAIQTARERGFL